MRMSGRARSKSDGRPTGRRGGIGGSGVATSSSASSAPGCNASNTAMAWRSVMVSATRGGRCACVLRHQLLLLVDVEGGDKAGLCLGQCQRKNRALRLFLVGQDFQPRLVGAQLHVIGGDLGGQRHLAIMHLPLGRFTAGLRRFHCTAHAAKDIDFPGGVEAQCKQRYVGAAAARRAAARATRQIAQGIGAGMQMCGIAHGVDLGQAGGAGHDLLLTRRAHSALRRQQIGILGKRTCYQAFQFGIVELGPPSRQVRTFRHRQRQRRCCLDRRAEAGGHRDLRRRIIRPDGATGQQQDRQQGTFHAAPPSPPPSFLGFSSNKTKGVTANTTHIRTQKTSM